MTKEQIDYIGTPKVRKYSPHDYIENPVYLKPGQSLKKQRIAAWALLIALGLIVLVLTLAVCSADKNETPKVEKEVQVK